MNTVLKLLLVIALCPGLVESAKAQWPLGKELPATALKGGEPSPGITSSGRFQMFTSPNAKGHTFMIDTDTGRLWIMKKDAVSGNFSMQRIPVDEVDNRKPDASK